MRLIDFVARHFRQPLDMPATWVALTRHYLGIISVLSRYYLGIISVLSRYYLGIISVLSLVFSLVFFGIFLFSVVFHGLGD